MPEDQINPQPHQRDENVEGNENTKNTGNDRFQSDAEKIVHRHLKNKDDIITDEDIASVRVGLSAAEFDEATEARFEDENVREDVENEHLEGTEEMKEDKNLDKGQITPWDTIDPTK